MTPPVAGSDIAERALAIRDQLTLEERLTSTAAPAPETA